MTAAMVPASIKPIKTLVMRRGLSSACAGARRTSSPAKRSAGADELVDRLVLPPASLPTVRRQPWLLARARQRGLNVVVERIAVTAHVFGDGSNARQQIFDAMIERGDQQVLLIRGSLACGDMCRGFKAIITRITSRAATRIRLSSLWRWSDLCTAVRPVSGR
jgi:hypothetical protein